VVTSERFRSGSPTIWRLERLVGRTQFVVLADGRQPVGTVGARAEDESETELVSMWVAPDGTASCAPGGSNRSTTTTRLAGPSSRCASPQSEPERSRDPWNQALLAWPTPRGLKLPLTCCGRYPP
jgi:hypothetical protein